MLKKINQYFVYFYFKQPGPTSRSVAIKLFPRPTINKYHLALGSVYTELTNEPLEPTDEGYILRNIIKRSKYSELSK